MDSYVLIDIFIGNEDNSQETEHFLQKVTRYISKREGNVNNKKLLYVTCFILLVLGIAGTVWAQSASYNRPMPTMDYVPQELGIYDTMYNELTEQNCRECHGDSTARHHGVPMV